MQVQSGPGAGRPDPRGELILLLLIFPHSRLIAEQDVVWPENGHPRCQPALPPVHLTRLKTGAVKGDAVVNKRILIVEDERVVAEQLQRSLAASGYEIVGVVASGEEAITHGRQSQPDLVVMDIVLSGKVDGISAAQQLQPLGIPIVYLTGYSDRHLLERAQHTEPLGYVIKPAKSEELAAVIKLALFKREKEQERNRAGQKRQAAYREADEQFRLMVAGVTDLAIFTLDVSGKVNSWNRGAEKINGYRAEDIIGLPHLILFTAEDRQQGIPEKELALAEQNGSADNTRWLVRQNGERYWADGVLTSIRDESGTLTGFTKIIRDATRKQKYPGRASENRGETSHCLACCADGHLGVGNCCEQGYARR